ncbi:hypothetical protein PS900_04190 [Pseudomonas fluorescens]|uniref:Endonuclease/exonuclease/phosphatase domain-containing protein n=1 Tax=Pseudomonas fluorescens TaxID=294 RepID=A0A8H2RTR4_PSEFL|nr:endonuclease/exonuclease/phosphatase family protein [Pseudomonas fluorescens]VVP27700.1 hypothetical protein PS900_04190 [Pseudomonas fluorescens]
MIESTSISALLNLLLGYAAEIIFLFLAGISLAFKRLKWVLLCLAGSVFCFVFSMTGVHPVASTIKPPSHETALDLDMLSVSIRSSNPRAKELLQQIIQDDYDIIALQEVSDTELISSVLKSRPDYYGFYNKDKATAIISKFEAIEHSYTKNIQKVTLKVRGNQELTLYNLHAPKFIYNISQYNLFFHELITEVSDNAQRNIVIAGDFNSTKENYWRRLLGSSKGFTSAVHDVGKGWLATFPTQHRVYGHLGSFLSIDDIYVKGLEVTAAKVLNQHYGSDHYPVNAQIRVMTQP